MSYSVNCCEHCKKNLTLSEDQAGFIHCAECQFFESIGVYTIIDYNNWLRGNWR